MMWVRMHYPRKMMKKSMSRVTSLFERTVARRCFSVLCCAFVLLLHFAASPASAQEPLDRFITLDVHANTPLEDALIEWGTKAGMTVMINTLTVSHQVTKSVRGTLTARNALILLLRDTGLSYTQSADRIRLVPAATLIPSALDDEPPPASPTPKISDTQPNTSVIDESHSSSRSGEMTEVLVTAQKRSERIIDVPATVSAISGDTLQSLQVNSLEQLSGYVPGLAVASAGTPGYRTIVIRGLSDGYASDTTGPLVATYIDDVPIGSSTASGRGNLFGVDLQPYDIDQIEVLEGPQGTLYGANTMGGLIKYTLRKPDMTKYSFGVGGELRYVNASGDIGRSGHMFFSVPLINDVLALRVSGFYQDDPGFIYNVGTKIHDANSSTESGGRATLLWNATDHLQVQANVILQDISADDQTVITTNGPTLQPLYGPQTSFSNFPEPFSQQIRSYSLHVNWDLGFANLTSTSGWSSLDTSLQEDFTVPYGASVPNNPDALSLLFIDTHVSKFVQEARLASSGTNRLQWLVGAYFTRELSGEKNTWPSFTPSHVPLPQEDNLYISDNNSEYKEKAVFVNLTYKVTDHLDLAAGERYSWYTQEGCPGTTTGVFGQGFMPCTSLPSTGVSVWMTTARWHFDQNSMVYGRIATGYRPGSGCPTCGIPALGIPGVVNPDRITNYEIGYKAALLEQKLQLAFSVYNIDWTDIQLQQRTAGGFVYTGNGGTARSTGFEFSGSYQATPNLRLNLTLAETDAYLTEDAPGVYGFEGDPLPESARWAASIIAEYTYPIGERTTLNFGGSYRYKDSVNSQFPSTPPDMGGPATVNPQNLVDLHAGVTFDRVTLRLFAKNIFNNRSYTGLMFINDPAMPKFAPVLPRSIGLDAEYQF